MIFETLHDSAQRGELINDKGVYVIRNLVSGTFYIGSTTRSFRERKNEHWSRLYAGDHCNPRLQASWNKHGAEAFVFEIIEVVDNASAVLEAEQRWLDQCTGDPKTCNLCSARNRAGVPVSEETRALLSEKAKQQMADPQVRRNLSDSTKKLWSNPEYRARVRVSHIGKTQTENTRKLKSEIFKKKYDKSDEYRERIANMLKTRWSVPGQREKAAARTRQQWIGGEIRKRHADKVAKVFDGFIAPDGTVYRNIKNLMAFCREHGLNARTMSDVFYGARGRKSHKGWIRYYSESET